MTASERGNTSRGSGRGRSRPPAEEPDVGLDPGTLGSCPELKADAEMTVPPRCPDFFVFKQKKHVDVISL